MVKLGITSVGYFLNAGDKKPAYDPGLHVVCAVCGKSLWVPVMTISLQPVDGRSYFFRVHRECWRGLSVVDQDTCSGHIVDTIMGGASLN